LPNLIFIFIFLPVFFLLYFVSKDKYKNTVLLLASLFFYSWGEPKYVLLMVFSILINYIFARLIDKYRDKAKIFLVLSIVINIGLLFFFKYTNFFIGNLNNIFGLNINYLNILLPIGISFYTFQAISYVVDVYRKTVKVQKNIVTLGAYIALFPQLIAGPIVRYDTIEKQLSKRKITLEKFTDGFRRFIIGLGKKVIIANNVAIIADTIFNGNVTEYGALILIVGVLAYTFQIYFDFSGYSDMAIGLGKMLGFDFLENFNYPYISKSITEFWRRWHISLSSWFRDYVYIPLGGNRVAKWKWIRNILIVWACTGFWHGASWNFIIWGLYFAVILLIEKLYLNKYLEKIPKFFRWCYAFILICVGWVIFRVENMPNVLAVLHNIFTFKSSDLILFTAENYPLLNYLPYMVIAAIGSFPFINNLYKKMSSKNGWCYVYDLWLIIIFLLSIAFLLQSTYNPFIYFRF